MEWLISANREMYDHVKAFMELPYVDWEQKYNYSIGDLVYIYSAIPVQAIDFLVEVIATDISSAHFQDDKLYWHDMKKYKEGKARGKFVRFKLIKYFGVDAIPLEELCKHGLKGRIQGARKLLNDDNSTKELGLFIKSRVDDISRRDENEKQDLKLHREIASERFDKNEKYVYSDKVKDKTKPIETKGIKIYKRDKETAIRALGIAGFRCEIDCNHYTFIRKNTNIYYTEPHHLIPMAYQDDFDKSIDIEENIVSLCSNCHNEIHYGRDAKKLIEKLYNQRKEFLAKKKLNISLEKLFSYYN